MRLGLNLLFTSPGEPLLQKPSTVNDTLAALSTLQLNWICNRPATRWAQCVSDIDGNYGLGRVISNRFGHYRPRACEGRARRIRSSNNDAHHMDNKTTVSSDCGGTGESAGGSVWDSRPTRAVSASDFE